MTQSCVLEALFVPKNDSRVTPLQFALSYAKSGMFVLPIHEAPDGKCSCGLPGCDSPGKHPRCLHGANDATVDETQIRAWWTRWPTANVAIGCGPSGIVVLDIDPRNGGDGSFEALRDELGATAFDTKTQTTAGHGVHYLFRAPVEPVGNDTKGKLGPGIDIKAAGGYILVAPSANNGSCYAWEVSARGTTLAEFPEALLERLRPKGAVFEAAAEVAQGSRNNYLASMAGALRRKGLSPAAIHAAISTANKESCKPPLKDGDVERIAKSIGRYPPADPIEIRTNGSIPYGRVIRTRKLSSYTPEEISWLWNNRIPRGKVSILAGDGGEGKSFATLGLAAALTTGAYLPGGGFQSGCDVLIWNGEDGPEDTIFRRAEKAGANMDRIEIITVEQNGKVVGFSLHDLPALTATVEANPAFGLVVIDPVTALLATVDSSRDAEVRSALQPLADLALRTRVAVLLVMHLKKGDEMNILHRISGSIGFGALARSALFLGTHAVSGRKSIDCIKHNLSPVRPEPVEFSLGEKGFQWVGLAPELTAEAIRMSKGRANHRTEAAEDYVKAMLADGAVDSQAIWHGARERGISEATLKRVRAKLGVRAKKHGFGESARWTWSLSEESHDETLPTGMGAPVGAHDPLRASGVIPLEEYKKTSFARGRGEGAHDPLPVETSQSAKNPNETLWREDEEEARLRDLLFDR